jgi:hypothetical protein
VLGPEALLLRFFAAPERDARGRAGDDARGRAGDAGGDRLLIMNLGHDLQLASIADPLVAPPRDMCWEILWSSEDAAYGGAGAAPLDTGEQWHIPGHATLVLSARPR